MGLTETISDMANFRPMVSVVVNGQDMTGAFMPRLISISLTDTAGIQADKAEIVLADHIPMMPIALPKTGAEIEIALGYQFVSKVVGLYVVDEVEVSGPPGQVRITAFASGFGASDGGKTAINEPKTRSWPEGTSVSALVAKISKAAGYKAAVSAEASKVTLAHLDQIAESDMNLLSRVARENGLIFKPGGGALVVVTPGESTSVDGTPLPVVELTPAQVTRWRFAVNRREATDQVVTTYRDLNGAATVDVAVDAPAGAADQTLAGQPKTRRLKRTYASEAAARRAAKAEADRAYRQSRRLTLDLPGRPDLTAEARLQLIGWRPGVPTEWLITSVRHDVGAGGWRSSVEAELPPPT
ncbi:hypothetical protein SAMN05878503_12714 [Cereibacter ovatus]|uniref:Phage protein D n=1 Tax=Cereibacter ovatus TaxID=439529 RepID=A0A285D515_9RHOB|nr:contractile injection system protein, VgrG/Pvc8 family [Cereibacter ovatus]SNX74859.1 hypothetical protein SAMN05878503_12714 [Cereibacter ovatus]